MTDLSTPPLRTMTSACSSGDSPSTSFTSRDGPAVCALAKTGMHESRSAPRTAEIKEELTCCRHTCRIVGPFPSELRVPLAVMWPAADFASDGHLKIISG